MMISHAYCLLALSLYACEQSSVALSYPMMKKCLHFASMYAILLEDKN